MSTRAEILDEERKRAEGSLVGLQNKLKNLEEVHLLFPVNTKLTPLCLRLIYKLSFIQVKSFSVCFSFFITAKVIYKSNCRQYCFGLLGLISAVLMLGWR